MGGSGDEPKIEEALLCAHWQGVAMLVRVSDLGFRFIHAFISSRLGAFSGWWEGGVRGHGGRALPHTPSVGMAFAETSIFVCVFVCFALFVCLASLFCLSVCLHSAVRFAVSVRHPVMLRA